MGEASSASGGERAGKKKRKKKGIGSVNKRRQDRMVGGGREGTGDDEQSARNKEVDEIDYPSHHRVGRGVDAPPELASSPLSTERDAMLRGRGFFRRRRAELSRCRGRRRRRPREPLHPLRVASLTEEHAISAICDKYVSLNNPRKMPSLCVVSDG